MAGPGNTWSDDLIYRKSYERAAIVMAFYAICLQVVRLAVFLLAGSEGKNATWERAAWFSIEISVVTFFWVPWVPSSCQRQRTVSTSWVIFQASDNTRYWTPQVRSPSLAFDTSCNSHMISAGSRFSVNVLPLSPASPGKLRCAHQLHLHVIFTSVMKKLLSSPWMSRHLQCNRR